MRTIVKIILLTLFALNNVWAQNFVIQHIQFNGLHRVSAHTAASYLPVKRGDLFTSSQSANIIKSLYQSGFFSHVDLAVAHRTLIINVDERPTIGKLKITGNSAIPTDKLTSFMKNLNLVEGRVYNPLLLERIKQSLLIQYSQQGYHYAEVNINTSPMPRNRVAINIAITEGEVPKIANIAIVGHQAFSESTLIKAMDITTSGLFTFFTQTDRFSQEKLDASLDKLRNFYYDHGYLQATVKAEKVNFSSNKKSIDITIVVHEGAIYTVNEVVIEGDMIFASNEMQKYLSTINKGDVFSRQKVLDIEKDITTEYGKKGYLLNHINVRPYVNELDHTVRIVFIIAAGKQVYIRHINFINNLHTNDLALRRELIQMEAAPASYPKLEESKRRLRILPFIKDVDMAILPVEGTTDQVDANYTVKEDSSAQANFKIGYSPIQKIILGVGFNQKNVLGTGNTLAVNLERSRSTQQYEMEYIDPYYTMDGVSRSFSFSVSRFDPGKVKRLVSSYTNNNYTFGVMYGFPIGMEENAFNRFLAGIFYENSLIRLVNGRSGISNQIQSFVNQFGRHFQQMDLRLGLTRDSRDKSFFPTSGSIQSLFFDFYAPVDRNSLTYYTFSYHGKWYAPITDQFILHTRGNVGYGKGLNGDRSFPFFKNFYAGGFDSVRGYYGFSLGPRDSLGKATGGNILVDASIGLIFPNYISENVRTMFFFDAGNVYDHFSNTPFGGLSRNAGAIKYSFGLEADIMTPFGPIGLSLAKPINPRHSHPRGSGNGDEPKYFDFSIGASF